MKFKPITMTKHFVKWRKESDGLREAIWEIERSITVSIAEVKSLSRQVASHHRIAVLRREKMIKEEERRWERGVNLSNNTYLGVILIFFYFSFEIQMVIFLNFKFFSLVRRNYRERKRENFYILYSVMNDTHESFLYRGW